MKFGKNLLELVCLVALEEKIFCLQKKKNTFASTKMRTDFKQCGQQYQHVAAPVISSPVQSV